MTKINDNTTYDTCRSDNILSSDVNPKDNFCVNKCTDCELKQSRIKSLVEEIRQLKELVKLHESKSKVKLDVCEIKDDAQMLIYTGMTKSSFNNIFMSIRGDASKFRYWQGPKRTANKVRHIKPSKRRYLSMKNEFFLSMVKIKTGLHMRILGDMFNISSTAVSRICFTWWRYLGRVIGGLVFNPEKDAVKLTLPQSFRCDMYKRVRHIIDATEVFIETPKSLEIAASCWSDYKHHHTAKFLVSINPNGFINFVSKAWVGRASDNYVTEHCSFLDILEPQDKVINPTLIDFYYKMSYFPPKKIK